MSYAGTFKVSRPIRDYFDGGRLHLHLQEPYTYEVGAMVTLFDPDYEFAQFEIVCRCDDGTVELSPAVPWPDPSDA